MTTISLGDPRVELPGVEYVTVPAIHDALEALVRVNEARWEAVTRLNQAQRAFHSAAATDQAELAEILAAEDGRLPAKRRARTMSAQEVLDDAKADADAYGQAVRLAYTRFVRAIAEHGEEWHTTLAERQRDAALRYEAAAAELEATGRELIAVGGLLGMLEASDGMPVIRSWQPGAVVSIAATAVAEALPVVRADVEATAAAPVEADADELVEV